MRIVLVGMVLLVGWLCCYCTGLWRYVPPLRYWTINFFEGLLDRG